LTHIERIYALDRLHCLILRKGTGRAKDLAKRFEISERSVHNLINDLRELGAQIRYSKIYNSYIYEQDIIFQFLISPKTNNSQ
jgi:predicted DNA-binding transcriptional regulator YafY